MIVSTRGCRIAVITAILMTSGLLLADEQQSDLKTRQAIELGLNFLKEDAAKWRSDHQCATCHHGTMTVFALAEARRSGLEIDAASFSEIVEWTKERLSQIDKPRDPRPGYNMVNSPAIYLGLLDQFVPAQKVVSPEELGKIRSHLLRHQETDGSWDWSHAPAKNRPPPFFESNEVATLLALLTISANDLMPDDTLREARQKAVTWLTRADETETTQAALLRMVWRKRIEPDFDLQPAIERFLIRQRPDGGFAQSADRFSDAYATGQSIYLLNFLGMPAERPAIQQAISFLVATQCKDGSWSMTRRSHEGVIPSDNLIPITYFGSAWATLGLLRSTAGRLR